MLADSTVKNSPWKLTSGSLSSRRISARDSSNTAARRQAGTRNAATRPAGRLEAEHRQHPARRQPGQRGELLGHQHRCRPGSTATPVPTFSRCVRASAQLIPMNGSISDP